VAARQVVGVVVAAGDGERMGGSKALLLVDGEPLARLHSRRLREAGCGEVVVVTRPAVAALLDKFEADRVVSSDAPDQAGSLGIAVRAVDAAQDAVFVITPVDAVPGRSETIGALIRAVDGGAAAATPQYHGRRGHPIACRAAVLSAYLSREPPPPPLRDTLAALADTRVTVEVNDPLILLDLDVPADVQTLTGGAPRFWRPA
jgi:CTP:molybdopterin cytidylyltransferase MocA